MLNRMCHNEWLANYKGLEGKRERERENILSEVVGTSSELGPALKIAPFQTLAGGTINKGTH